MGLAPEMAARLTISNERRPFDRAVKETKYPPQLLASFFINKVKMLRREGTLSPACDEKIIMTLKEAAARGIASENLVVLIEKTCGPQALPLEAAIAALGLENPKKIEKEIAAFLKTIDPPPIEKEKLKRHVMGLVMNTFQGKLPGKAISDIVDGFVS
jgi:Glu-tRNA(Gln) amidotransferase subunit E-like FAD-binding protein